MQAAALQAGVVWRRYGEQSTFWFYHLARDGREHTVIAQLGTAGQPGHITLDTYASIQQARQTLEAYFSASSPEGLFEPPDTLPQEQQELLMALDLFFLFFWGRKLTCPSMPIMSAIRKTDKANHRRVSGPQHIL